MPIIFDGINVSASATSAGAVIALTGHVVTPDDNGVTLYITGGSGFTVGTYQVLDVDSGNGLWILNQNCCSGPASGMTGVGTPFAAVPLTTQTFPPFIPSPPPTAPATVRTTAALVEGIIQVQDGIDLTPFIYTANMITTELCGQSGYSDGFVNSQMELIERWLAAHFYAIYDQQLTSARAGSVSVVYQSKVMFNLMGTTYGQQAMMLDVAGNLAKFTNKVTKQRQIKISIGWLGEKCWPGPTPIYPDLTVVQ